MITREPEFLLDCAEDILKLYEILSVGEKRFHPLIETARRFIHNEATREELDVCLAAATQAKNDLESVGCIETDYSHFKREGISKIAHAVICAVEDNTIYKSGYTATEESAMFATSLIAYYIINQHAEDIEVKMNGKELYKKVYEAVYNSNYKALLDIYTCTDYNYKKIITDAAFNATGDKHRLFLKKHSNSKGIEA